MSPKSGMQAWASSIVLRHRLFLSSEMPTTKPAALIACLGTVSATAWLSDMFGKWTNPNDWVSRSQTFQENIYTALHAGNQLDTSTTPGNYNDCPSGICSSPWTGFYGRWMDGYFVAAVGPPLPNRRLHYWYVQPGALPVPYKTYHNPCPLEKSVSKAIASLISPDDVRFQVLLDLLAIVLDLQTDTLVHLTVKKCRKCCVLRRNQIKQRCERHRYGIRCSRQTFAVGSYSLN